MLPPADADAAPLSRWEKLGLVLFGVLVVAFGGLILVRSAFQKERKTDFGCYARAAYAVRTGQDIYHKDICDDRGWHYAYPPAFAVLMVPFADPFVWEDHSNYLPWWASIALWYAISIGCLAYAVHALAGVVLPGAVPWSRRWWYARTVPVYVCLGGIGATLSRGQVNLQLVALLAAMFAASARGRSIASGVWLAAAITLKVIPGVLVLYPLVRRDWRAGVGAAIGLVGLLVALPVAVWGFDGAVETNRRFVERVLMPGSTGDGDQTRARELTDATATDSQSFQAVIHNWRNPDKATRPHKPDRATRLAHWVIGGALALLTLAVAWWRARPDAADQLVVFGCLCALMTLLTPVSHMHYYAMVLPLVAGLWLKGLAERPGSVSAGPWVLAVLVAWGVLTAVPNLPYPPTLWMRDRGLGVAATVALWLFALAVVARREAVAEYGELPEVPGSEGAGAAREAA